MKLLTLMICFLLIACTTTENITYNNTIQIGGIYALTSFGAGWGSEEHLATQLAMDEANAQGGIDGKKLALIAEDSQTDPKQAVTAFNKLLHQDAVPVIIGPTWQASSQAVTPLARNADLVLISPSDYVGIQEQHTKNLFSTYPPFEYEIIGMLPYIKEKEMKHFAVIYNDEPFSATMKDIFVAIAKENNWNVIILQQATGDKDYRTNILKVRNTKNIDAIYAPLAVDEDVGLLMKQMQESNVKLPVLSISSIEQPNVLQNHGREIEGVIYPYPKETHKYQEFAQKYQTAYGVKPSSPSAATAYDATNLVIDALQSGAQTPQEISTYLHNVKEYEGVSNTITFDENGIIASKDYILKTVKDGKFVILQE